MKFTKSYPAIFLNLSLIFFSLLSFTVQSISAQDIKIALQRGYRTGYSDGYISGYRDIIENTAKSYDKHSEYAKADRAYNKDYGKIEDYRDGYQQGFESGYNTGFEKRSFDAAIPANLNNRGSVAAAAKTNVEIVPPPAIVEEILPVKTPVETTQAAEQIAETAPPSTANTEVATTQTEYVNASAPVISGGDTITIPVETELLVELLSSINTELGKEGDKFQARIVSPGEMNGAFIEGRISQIRKPGRIKRRAEMLLSFDRIVLSENRWSNFNAILTEVLPIKGDNVNRVDVEGIIEGNSSVKPDSAKVSAATGTGLVVGAIAGGPVGAAVGAGVGAAVGVSVVVIERGKHIRLNKTQQLRIKTAYETQIR